MQLQTNILGRRGPRSDIEVVGAIRAAAMAFGANQMTMGHVTVFETNPSQAIQEKARADWAAALAKARA